MESTNLEGDFFLLLLGDEALVLLEPIGGKIKDGTDLIDFSKFDHLKKVGKKHGGL